ncbi:hypothetical protein GCM10007989_16870 [Devosia pacifica]|uniref:Uncharacterized protein n=1 Tax=Devosia pacifica TaxID=1335967 RepID=A0A918VTL5_9HYPH|nr:hypothetical protein GCM10007989_16870 [Devosia pacifica]
MADDARDLGIGNGIDNNVVAGPVDAHATDLLLSRAARHGKQGDTQGKDDAGAPEALAHDREAPFEW